MSIITDRSAAEVTTFGHQSTSLSKIASLCEELKLQLAGSQNGSVDPRLEIPTDTRDMLVTWLLGDPRVCEDINTYGK